MHLPSMRKLERHRKFQIIISVGIVGSAFIAFVDPVYSMHSLITSSASSLLWLWE